MYRARLSQIQAFSEGFNGFTEEELLELAADILELAADRSSEGG